LFFFIINTFIVLFYFKYIDCFEKLPKLRRIQPTSQHFLDPIDKRAHKPLEIEQTHGTTATDDTQQSVSIGLIMLIVAFLFGASLLVKSPTSR
jgi:hypothetical protein